MRLQDKEVSVLEVTPAEEVLTWWITVVGCVPCVCERMQVAEFGSEVWRLPGWVME